MQQHAYRMVKAALNAGRLVRPSRCERCGKTPRRGSDGRSLIHAHHADYSKPLQIEWICAWCHREETPKPLGRAAQAVRLTEQQIQFIRENQESSTILGARFGVDSSTIRKARRRETWAWLSARERKD